MTDVIFEFFDAHTKGDLPVDNTWARRAALGIHTPRVQESGILAASARRITIPQQYTTAAVITPQGRVLWQASGSRAFEIPASAVAYKGMKLIQYR